MKWIMGLGIASALVLSGCADRGDWAGEWMGRRPVSVPPGGDPSVAETLAIVKLTISADGTFKLTEEGFGKTGSGSYGSDTATIEVRELDGLQRSETKDYMGRRKLRLDRDGSMEFVRDGDPPVTLSRHKSE